MSEHIFYELTEIERKDNRPTPIRVVVSKSRLKSYLKELKHCVIRFFQSDHVERYTDPS